MHLAAVPGPSRHPPPGCDPSWGARATIGLEALTPARIPAPAAGARLAGGGSLPAGRAKGAALRRGVNPHPQPAPRFRSQGELLLKNVASAYNVFEAAAAGA